MNSQPISEKIDAFLSGQLPKKEAEAFSAEIAHDAALAAKVDAHRLEQEAIHELVRQHLDLDLARWRENMHELPLPPSQETLPIKTVVRTTFTPLKWLWSAIGLLLLLALAWWLWRKTSNSIDENPTLPPPTVEKPKGPFVEAPAPAIGPTVEQAPKPPVQQPKKPAPKESYEGLLALADENMNDLQGSIEKQMSATRGTQTGELGKPYFNQGLDDFLKKKYSAAKSKLLQVEPAMTDYYPYAQKMLALIYYSERNYRQAATCFEQYAAVDASPATRWRLLHFYLADYRHQHSKFWRELNQFAEGENGADFQAKAIQLRDDLKKKGFEE